MKTTRMCGSTLPGCGRAIRTMFTRTPTSNFDPQNYHYPWQKLPQCA
ncbi:hypothetical protein FOPG_17705 [Fusarium oxysporum f. sp. conglutinans race 2 54008]|uniref:Uncharacterized protein n=1 Tax=Fusarium oxysporum f. sp. conglutinans race 2 54008 TaxID=1089457 RepID=X0HYA7_FUSOX|nr:hypothetical protein FOPG_17705 [Fusarium oxysporum f. sp. conglutinans race 2 54008]